jgi:DNA helicase IV
MKAKTHALDCYRRLLAGQDHAMKRLDEHAKVAGAERYTTWANVFTGLAKAIEGRPTKPFDHVVIDEAQDLAPAELRFFAALAPAQPDGLFLSGDIGQRIFQHPYSCLGVDVRSHMLKVCYRTSQQIRRPAADRLLPTVLLAAPCRCGHFESGDCAICGPGDREK